MSRISMRLLSTIIVAVYLLALTDAANAFGHHRCGGGGYGGCGYGGGGGYGGCGNGGYGGYGYGGYGYGYAGYGYNPYVSNGYRYGGYYAMPSYPTRPPLYATQPSAAPTRNLPSVAAPTIANRVIPARPSVIASANSATSPPSPSDRPTNIGIGATPPTNMPSGTPNALVGR